MGTSLKAVTGLLRKIKSLRILVVGDVMLDRYIWGDATRISPEAPVPVIDIARETWTAGGAGNVGQIGRALVSALERRGLDGATVWPWYFPDAEEYCARLTAGGFTVITAQLFERPTALPTGMAGWLATFAGPFLRHIREDERKDYLSEVVDSLKGTLQDSAGCWRADYVRLRFSAINAGETHT